MTNTSTDRPADLDAGLSFLPAPAQPEPLRPEPPQIGQLHSPDDLPPLHQQLLVQAEALAGRDTGAIVGRSEADRWVTAANKVNQLWGNWRHRLHATDAHETMLADATKAVHAALEAVRSNDWRDAHRWFDVAAGWIDHLKMQADYESISRPLPAPIHPAEPNSGPPLLGWLWGRRRTPTTARARMR